MAVDKLWIFALIVTAWGIRLTYNFARKGAYRLRFWEGNEDYRWAITGSVRLVLLFMGSSTLGERISSGKYPAYKDYMQQVFKYLPLRKFDPYKCNDASE